MSKAKQKHKAEPHKSNLQDLEFLLDVFSVVITKLMAHPALNPAVHSCLLDTVNDLTNEFNNAPQDWALGNRYSLMRALHNAHAQQEVK